METGQWSQGTWPVAAVTLGMRAVAPSRWPWGKAGATPRSGIIMDLCPPMIMALLLVFASVFTKISKCVLLQPLHFPLVLSTVPPQLIIFPSSERQLFVFWMHECHFLCNSVVTLTLDGDKNFYLSHIRVIYWRLSTLVITGILGAHAIVLAALLLTLVFRNSLSTFISQSYYHFSQFPVGWIKSSGFLYDIFIQIRHCILF